MGIPKDMQILMYIHFWKFSRVLRSPINFAIIHFINIIFYMNYFLRIDSIVLMIDTIRLSTMQNIIIKIYDDSS